MQNKENFQSLINMFDDLENNFEKFVIEELRRIGGPIWSLELIEEIFNFGTNTYFDSLYPDADGHLRVVSIGSHSSTKYLSELINDGSLPPNKMIMFLKQLVNIAPRNIYHMKARLDFQDIRCTIHDLVPLRSKTKFSFGELSRLLDFSDYVPDWDQPMEYEYEMLFSRSGHIDVDFFQIQGTEVVVVPGKYLYTTTLSKIDVTSMR